MAGLEDFQGFEDQLRNELDKLDRYHEDDRPFVKRFVRRLDGKTKQSTQGEYLKNLRKTAERLDQPITSLTRIDFEDHVYDLRHSAEYGRGPEPGMSDGTIRNIEFVVRRFLDVIGDDVDGHNLEWAEDYELTPPPETKVKPSDMLRPADINALTDGANNMRDVALIEFLADTGARLSLVGSLRVGDVDLEGPKKTYTPNPNAIGLKGAEIMAYPIIDSAAVLRNYLRNVHPRPDQDDVALFHKIPGHGNDVYEGDGSLGPSSIRDQLRKAAEYGGVDRPVNPHNFRHSAVTRMRREGYDRSEVEHRVHWDVDSDMWKTYEHIAGQEHNDAIFEKAGVVDADEGDTLERVRRPCGNCAEPVAPQHDYCPSCAAEVSKRAREMKQAATTSLANGVVDLEAMNRQEFLTFLIQHLEVDPSQLGTHGQSPSSSSSESSSR